MALLQVNFNMHAADDVQKAIRQLRVHTESSVCRHHACLLWLSP